MEQYVGRAKEFAISVHAVWTCWYAGYDGYSRDLYAGRDVDGQLKDYIIM